MIWHSDGTFELEEVEKVAKAGFDEMSEWTHADQLAWTRVAVHQKFGDDAPAIDVTFWEWLIWDEPLGPVVEAPAQMVGDQVVWVADL